MTSWKQGHAIVMGSGMAGLLAARVLADFYERVSVVERDVLPDSPSQRKGVPQGRHLHSCLSRGYQVLDELFPGLSGELVIAGARPMDSGDLSRVFTRIGRHALTPSGKFRDPAALVFYLASRPLLEFHVRQRVQGLANVTFLDGHDILGLLATADVVTGIRIAHRNKGIEFRVDADLVVDATGRASRTPAALEELGYDRPAEERSEANWAYSSQLLSIPEGRIATWMTLVDPGADSPLGGLLAYEHGTWILTIGRPANGEPPRDFDEMLLRALEVMPPTIAAALQDAVPVGDVAVFRNTAGVRRRYEQMVRFPGGLVVIGDALCSPNPIYGQGMTLAALEAVALRECLRNGNDDLASRFFSAAVRHIGPTWAMNQAGDRDKAFNPNRRSLAGRAKALVMRSILTAASRDIAVTERLLRVRNLIDTPMRLRDPALMARVLAVNLRHLQFRPQS